VVSERNVELVRRSVAVMNSRELSDEMFEGICTPDFTITNASTAVTDKTYRGASGAREWIADFTEAFAAGPQHELGEVLAVADDFVVARLRWSGRGARSGAPLVLRWVGVWRFRDGKVCRGTGYPSGHEALKAVGLEE
jgi:ketosteroid isomerase-like protein